MRRVAILSDVHGYVVALRAVLADVDALGVDEIVVAGDMVNWGPASARVVDILRARGAQMIRGNHEQELVATFGTAAMPAALMTTVRYAPSRWSLESLGHERRAYLAALPDQLYLDEASVVVHGSPRHVRDAVTIHRTDDELRAMVAGVPARLIVSGHTHRPLLRTVPDRADLTEHARGKPDSGAARAEAALSDSPFITVGSETPDFPLRHGAKGTRRFVNAGAVGFALDGDPRASYALAETDAGAAPGEWRVTIRRVSYDMDAAIAAYDGGMRQACPEFVDLFAVQMRAARDYFGLWNRTTGNVPDEAIGASIRRFLANLPAFPD